MQQLQPNRFVLGKARRPQDGCMCCLGACWAGFAALGWELWFWGGICCFGAGCAALLWGKICCFWGRCRQDAVEAHNICSTSSLTFQLGSPLHCSGRASSIGKLPSGLHLESDHRCKCFAVHSCARSEVCASLPEAGCSAPQIQNGRIVPAPRSTYAHKDTVTFECEPGYVIRGPKVVQCQQNNTWQPPVPTCEQGKWLASTAGATLPQCPPTL